MLISSAIAAILTMLSFTFFVLKPLSAPMTDLAVYMEAGSRMSQGLDIYDHVYNEDIRQRMLSAGEENVPAWYRMHYFYPPFLAALARPLADLNHKTAKFYWASLNFAFLLLSLLCMTAILDKGPLGKFPAAARFSALLFLTVGFDPFTASFSEGQIDIPVLFLLSLSALGAVKGKQILAGLSAGGAALLKISPGLVVLSFVFSRAPRALLAFAAALLAGLLWMLSLPQAAYSAFLEKFFVLASGGLETSLALNMSFVKALLLPAGLWKLNFAQTITRALILAVGILAMRDLSRTSRDNSSAIFSTAIVFMILLSPTTWAHHLVWLYLPLVLTANSLELKGQARDWINLGVIYCILGRSFSIQSIAFLSDGHLLPAAHALILCSVIALQLIIVRTGSPKRD